MAPYWPKNQEGEPITTVEGMQRYNTTVPGSSPEEIDDELKRASLEAPEIQRNDGPDDEILRQILLSIREGGAEESQEGQNIFFDHGKPEQWDSIPEGPPVSQLYELHAQHIENRKNHTSVRVDVPGMGIMDIEYSYLSLVENPRNIFIVFGGGIPSVDSYKALGYLLAWHGTEHGNAVILLPSPMNNDVTIIYPDEKGFANSYYRENKIFGPFSADGRIMAHALEKLLKQHQFEGNIRAVGLSTGGAQAMRTVQEAFRKNSVTGQYIHPILAEKIAGIYAINSGGMYPREIYENPRKRLTAAIKLAAGFAAEMTGIATNWQQIVINMLDAGSPPRSVRYLVRQAKNCVFPGIQELAAVLPDTVEARAIMVQKNLGDKAIPAKMTLRAIGEIPSESKQPEENGNATVSVLVLPGNHTSPLDAGNSVAITINAATLEDSELAL